MKERLQSVRNSIKAIRPHMRFYLRYVIAFLILLIWMYPLYLDGGSTEILQGVSFGQFLLHSSSYLNYRKIGSTVLFFALMWILARFLPDKQIKGHVWIELGMFTISLECFWIFFFFRSNEADFSFMDITPYTFLANFIPIYMIVRVAYLIFNSLALTNSILAIASMVIAGVNYYVILFRGTPLSWSDLRAIGTAAEVAENYDIAATDHMIYMFAVLFAMSFAFGFVEKERRKVSYSTVSALVVVLLGVFFGQQIFSDLDASQWEYTNVYYEQGTVASIISYYRYQKVNKPEGYTASAAEEILENVELEEQTDGETAANIIVIMNESLADTRTIDNGEVITYDYLPYIHSLMDGAENVISGYTYVPVFGGSTCQSEFEFLTGASTSFFTNGVAFQTIVNSNTNSVVRTMNSLDYFTEGFHPYNKSGWNRNAVYSYLGFDTFLGMDDDGSIEGYSYDAEDFVRYVSDAANYETLIAEEEAVDGNFFMFNVTIQNHGGYSSSQGLEELKVVTTGSTGGYTDAAIYMSSALLSDQAFEELIAYYENVDEPTLICMFGDHFPSLDDGFYDMLYGEDTSELSQQARQKMYETPFIIWTNYDIEEQQDVQISSNFLSALVLKVANVQMDAYTSFLWQLYQQYPVLSVNGIYDAEGNFYSGLDEIESDEIIMDYEYLMYYEVREK